MTEKPMVIDEEQCQAVLDAEKRTGSKIVVTFNYRYAPKHQKIKELLMSRRDRQGHVGRFHVVPRHLARRRLLPALASLCAPRAVPCGCTRRRTTSTSSTGGSTPTRSRSRRSAVSRTTARAGRSGTRTAAPARTRTSARSTGTSQRSRGLVELYVNARRRTAISATAASSGKTSTSSTRCTPSSATRTA